MERKRCEAIQSGVNNAVETVVVDKAMSRDKAYSILADFVSDGLHCHGYEDDRCKPEDLAYAQRIFPI